MMIRTVDDDDEWSITNNHRSVLSSQVSRSLGVVIDQLETHLRDYEAPVTAVGVISKRTIIGSQGYRTSFAETKPDECDLLIYSFFVFPLQFTLHLSFPFFF